MSELMPYIWIAVILSAALGEIYTLAFVIVWFIPSAIVVFILSLSGFSVWIQVCVFFGLSLILLILSKIISTKLLKYKRFHDNYDLLTGKSAIVTREINNYKDTGTIRINGFEWDAKTEDEDVIYESGIVVIVVAIEGATAICSR